VIKNTCFEMMNAIVKKITLTVSFFSFGVAVFRFYIPFIVSPPPPLMISRASHGHKKNLDLTSPCARDQDHALRGALGIRRVTSRRHWEKAGRKKEKNGAMSTIVQVFYDYIRRDISWRDLNECGTSLGGYFEYFIRYYRYISIDMISKL